ncbi:MAG: MFS transporter [Dehalococcoidia bacterium]
MADSPGHDTPESRSGTFEALRIRDFRLLWTGHVSHSLALWMEQISVPLLVLQLTGSGAHLGGVLAVRTVPQLLFGLVAGVISDWFDRRMIMLVDKVLIVCLYSAFAALVVLGRVELWHLYGLAFLRGTLMAFDQPARQSVIPMVVPNELLTSAVALMTATTNIMRMVGASLGGLTVALVGMSGAFVSVAVIYLGAVTATYLLRVPHEAGQAKRGMAAMGAGLVEGARFSFAHPGIRGVLLLCFVYFTFGMSYMQVFAPLFALRVLDIGDAGFGFLLSTSGFGALLGALFIASRPPKRLGFALPLIVSAFGAMLIVFALSASLPGMYGRGWLIAPFVAIAFAGMMQTGFFSLSNAALLHLAPPMLRGRVISLVSLDRAMITIGAAAAGVLAEVVGVQVAQIGYGAVCVAGGLAIFFLARGFRATVTTGRRTYATLDPELLPPEALPTDEEPRPTAQSTPADAPASGRR